MPPSLAEQAYQLLRADIISCVLKPGQQVVQSRLAAHYQIGTTPIRDALHRLARENLVQPVPRSGYVITPITLTDIQERRKNLFGRPLQSRWQRVRLWVISQ